MILCVVGKLLVLRPQRRLLMSQPLFPSIDVVTSSSIAVAAGVISKTFAVWKINLSLRHKKCVRFHLTIFFSRMIFENNHLTLFQHLVYYFYFIFYFTFIHFNFTLKIPVTVVKVEQYQHGPLLAAISRGLLSNYKRIKCVSSLVSLRGLLLRDKIINRFFWIHRVPL